MNISLYSTPNTLYSMHIPGMEYDAFSSSMQQRWAQEVGMPYPVLSKESLWLNTPLVANVMCAFLKPWMNKQKHKWDRIRLGCRMDWFDGRLDALMNVPSQEAAQEKMFHNLRLALVERYHHCKTFVLPELDADEEDEDVEDDNMESDLMEHIEAMLTAGS